MIQSDFSRFNARIDALALAPAQSRPADLTVEEWDALFAAVTWRLQRTVGTLLAMLDGNHTVNQAGTDLLECVEALGQLQAMLLCERERSQR